MNHFKRSAIYVVLSLMAIGCASQGSGTTTTASSSNATTAVTNLTGSDTALSLGVSASTVLQGGSVTFTAFGGSSSYDYINESSNLGSVTINGSTAIFTASTSATGTATVEVKDSSGNTDYATVQVVSPLVVTPSETSIAAGQTVSFSVSGGTAPYTYLLVVGSGSLSVSGSTSNTSTVYTSSSSDSASMELEVTDSSVTPQIIYTPVAITGSSSAGGSTFASYENVLVDDMVGITFYNAPSLSNPEIVFFGTGSKPNETTMFAHTAVSTCGHDSSGNTSSPCTESVSLTNYNNSSDYAVTYEGTINFSGRSGTGYVSFCIPPSASLVTSAYLLPSAGSFTGSATNNQFLTMSYNDSGDGRAFMYGAAATSFYAETDTTGGVGYTSIWISSAGFTSHTSCAGFGSSMITVN
jgi:hypothetical protein